MKSQPTKNADASSTSLSEITETQNNTVTEKPIKTFSDFGKKFQEKNTFYVYIDCTLEDIARPFYIGYGKKKRVYIKCRNSHHQRISKKYGCKREIILGTYDQNFAKEIEIQLISQYKTFVYDKNYIFGANYSLGGEGSVGYQHTEAHKKYISQKNKGLRRSDKAKIAYTSAAQERANNPEWRQKMSDVSKKRWENSEYREKFSKATTGKKRSAEQLERLRIAHKDAHKNQWTIEARKKQSETHKKLWQNENFRTKQLELRNSKNKGTKNA